MDPTKLTPADLEAYHKLGDQPVPDVVVRLAAGADLELVWRNELGGLTFRSANPTQTDRFIKWNPHSTGVDLRAERDRMIWLAGRHPAPTVVEFGTDDEAQWLVTEALPGEHAVGDIWRARTDEAITAIATGLRAIHSVPVDDFPTDWTNQAWAGRTPPDLGPRPPVDGPVLVHGDACAPNTLINADGEWVGHVDLGDLTVGDRWADLAIASLSLDWNFGPGHQDAFFAAYGVERDPVRIHYYRALWEAES